MNSRVYGSEDALAQLACEKFTNHPKPKVLIGGLGMGYTLRSALDGLGENAQVAVAELVPEVVQWNRGVLAELADRPLDDRRVVIHKDDVGQLIRDAKGEYNAIMLDVDNGPQALSRQGNNWLYSPTGLLAAFAALRRNGVLAIWASGPEPAFAQRLRQAGFEVAEVKVRARGGGKSRVKGRGGAHHLIWVAQRD
jgi:spermidine synthase